MSELLTRTLNVLDVDGRTFVGRAVTYDKPYRVTDDGGRSFYEEGMRQGALTRTIHRNHNTFEFRDTHRDVRLGIVRFNDDRAEYAAFEATLDDTDAGDMALRAFDSGVSGVSLGYRPVADHTADGVVWRTEVAVRELSFADTNSAQYDDARVLARRAVEDDPDYAELLAQAGRWATYSFDGEAAAEPAQP